MSAEQPILLPALREDLLLLEGPRLEDGSPSWTLHDPVANRFFRIGLRQFLLLRQWSAIEPEALRIAVAEECPGGVTLHDVEQLAHFLRSNQLVQDDSPAHAAHLLRLQQSRSMRWWQWLLKNYLFFRVPLVNPDAWLTRLYPRLRFVFSPLFAVFVIATSLLGLWLVSQQWETFFNSFSYLYSWSGGLLFLAALSLIKIIHECGHALACKHHGLRVPSMGVAMLVMMPVLYTDATEAWKLVDRKARAHIVAAGVSAELVMASLCCVLWFFLPEGPFRSAVFLLATTTWVMSLAVNLNPLMRFDGYYLLSDLLDLPNLQDRSFQLGRWQLRQWLFGDNGAPPEVFAPARHRWLCFYAYAVWIYRFFLFLGIALLVYHYFFKLLGIVLFAVEIGWFIVQPIMRELQHWWQQRHVLSVRRQRVLFAGAVLVFLLLCWPWQSALDVPALYRAGQFQRVFVVEAGRVDALSVKHGQHVRASDVLLLLVSPDLDSDISIAQKRIEKLQLDLSRRQTSSERLDTTGVQESALLQAHKALQALQSRREQLTLRAPFAGSLYLLDNALLPGRWLGKNTALFTVVNADSLMVDAYVDESDVRRVQVGNTAKFYAERGQLSPVSATVTAVAPVDSRVLIEPYLASVYGGDIPVRENAKHELLAERAFYRVQLALAVPNSGETLPSVLRGRAVIKGERRSLIGKWWDWVAGGFIRESGF